MTTATHHTEPVATPIFKWAGGKSSILPTLLQLVPASTETYFEPFAGGAALCFALAPQRAVLNDICRPLMRAYEVVKSDIDTLIAEMGKYKYARAVYDEMRARNFSVGHPFERAADFLFANKTAFNGLYRENSSGQYNTPFGKYENPTLVDPERLRNASRVLQNTTLFCGDFAHVLVAAQRGDFVYCDPPYAPVSSTSSFTSYTKKGFSWSDQVRLRDAALELRARGVRIVLSNADTPAVRDLYSGFSIMTVEVRRAINSHGNKRGTVTELIITG